jgi:hypothetical protein
MAFRDIPRASALGVSLRGGIGLPFRIPEPLGCLLHSEHGCVKDTCASWTGHVVFFEGARFIRRHIVKQEGPRPFWIDRAAFRNRHGLFSWVNLLGCNGGLNEVNYASVTPLYG